MCPDGDLKARKKAKTKELKRQAAAAKDGLAPAQDCGDGCFWSKPQKLLFWRDPSGTDAALLGGAGIVEFRAALVLPGATSPPEPGEDGDLEPLLMPEGAGHTGLPLAFFFPGLGEKAEDSVLGRYQDWAEVAPEPFILVAADRQPGRWWFIDDDTHWGWLSGEFRPEAADLVGAWMQELVGRVGVDPDRIGMFGFSAGAYAATELLAKGPVRLTGLGLGGVHGHGQSDLEGVPAKRSAGVVEKFQGFIGRLSEHHGVPWMEATHANSDQQSRWEDASRILGALGARQKELQLPELSVRVLDPEEHDSAPGSRKNKTHHDYFRAAFIRREFLAALLGGEAPEPQPLPEGLALVEPGEDSEEALGGPAAALPKPPPGPPPTSLEVENFSASCEDAGWEELAFEIFREHGFVIVLDLLKLHQYTAVLRDCERAAKEMVTQEKRGNRGPGRYSFGVASSTGSMLHVPSFARHLLDGAGSTLRPLLDLIFAEGENPGFMVLAGGGDFVLGDVRTHQDLHSDIQVSRAQNKHLPPPLLSVNFCVQELTQHNGPTRIVPGTQLKGGIDGDIEPTEWRCSRLCPVPAGAAIVRDVRVLHGGTPNMTPRTRYLPSIEYVSLDLRATNRKDRFPPIRGLPKELYNKLSPETQELCEEIVAGEGQRVKVELSRR